MASQPLIPPPDTIDPHAPPESPPPAWPGETAPGMPEYSPPQPDRDSPEPGVPEWPAQDRELRF
ncbi:MAG: hypothetical protein CMN73_09525 [Sphingomonas sp.]|nr:hypothetical protein [Sphingomonas sp.]